MDVPAEQATPTSAPPVHATLREAVRSPRRRRPTGAPPPLPYRLQTSGVGWLVAVLMLIGLTLAVFGRGLRLDKPGGRGLRFRVRDTIYPSRQLRPLLQGQRNGGDYRFGWQGVTSGSRLSGSGAARKGWEVAGMTREPTWPVPGPDPLTAVAGKDRFVFGVGPPDTARVVCQPPAGQPAVQLELFTVRGREPGGRSAGLLTGRVRARLSSRWTVRGASWGGRTGSRPESLS